LAILSDSPSCEDVCKVEYAHVIHLQEPQTHKSGMKHTHTSCPDAYTKIQL